MTDATPANGLELRLEADPVPISAGKSTLLKKNTAFGKRATAWS